MSDKPKQPEAFLTDDVSVGQLVRFLNHKCLQSARANEDEKMKEWARLSDQVETALNLYRKALE